MIEYKFIIRYPVAPYKIMYSKLTDKSYYKTYESDTEIEVTEITEEEWAAHLLHYITLTSET